MPQEIKNNYITCFIAQLVLLLDDENVQSSMGCCAKFHEMAKTLWEPSNISTESVSIELKGVLKVGLHLPGNIHSFLLLHIGGAI